MNLSKANGDFELRKRFGSSLESITDESKVSSAAYVWESIKSMKRKFTSFQAYEYEKKKTIRQNARYAVVYLASFLGIVTVLAMFMIWRNYGSESSTGVSDSWEGADYDFSHVHKEFPHHLFGSAHHHFANAGKPKDESIKWHKQMAELRPDDAINPGFNHIAISILLANLPNEDALLQTSITTFLRQMNFLQIASAHSAHAFVGGAHDSFITYTPQTNFFPALERYVDGFKTMLTFAPNQDWFIQIDEGKSFDLNKIHFSF